MNIRQGLPEHLPCTFFIMSLTTTRCSKDLKDVIIFEVCCERIFEKSLILAVNYAQNFLVTVFIIITAWKVSKYGVFSGPYFPVFGPEKTSYLDTFHAVNAPWEPFWPMLISGCQVSNFLSSSKCLTEILSVVMKQKLPIWKLPTCSYQNWQRCIQNLVKSLRGSFLQK